MASERPSGTQQKILQEARDRFKRGANWEAMARARFRDDVKFAEGDAYNNYQWPGTELDKRDKRPSLTINRVRQHNLDILNDARQSQVAIKVRPLRGGASYDSAEILDGVIKHIEYISNADAAYQHALKFAVQGGIGWIRIATDYVGDDSFDQEIFIRPVKDPLSVMLDPDITEADGSDARWGFVFTEMPKDEFDVAYPSLKDTAANNEIAPDASWVTPDHVRIAEYFRCVKDEDKLLSYINPDTGQRETKRKSKMSAELLAKVIDDPDLAERSVEFTKVEHFTIVGDQITEEKEWPGKYIPLARCIGEETVIDGQMDRKGHTRCMLDQQRMVNYNAAMDLETPVPTPSGWTKIGDIRPGDLLFDEHGKPAEVLGLSPIFVLRDCYRVTFDDGSSVVTDAEHKWTVEERGKRVPAGETWTKEDRRTDELVPGKHFIWQTRPLDLPEMPLPVHPYVLGYWLGNGRAAGSGISCHADDADEIRAHITDCGHWVSEARPYANGSRAADFTVFGLVTALRELGVVKNKHIPAQYLRASQSQREALLQGLMDSDGSISKQKQCSFQQVDGAVADGFAELLRSLGLKATFTKIAAVRSKFPQGHTSISKASTRFAFSADPGSRVFRLARKRRRLDEERPLHPRRTKLHRIKSVERVESVPTRCLAVDTPTHLFLAGDGMVPTHNSASVEYGALQTKVPWIVGLETIEETQQDWESANTENKAFLGWKEFDDEGRQHTGPTRPSPPTGAPVFLEGFKMAIEQMYLASGQNQADFGQPSNERSGKAIDARAREGDKATYHYLSHQSYMIRFGGKIILDLIPHIYDTARVIKYRDDAGNEGEVHIDPEAEQHFQTQEDPNDPDAPKKHVMNPKLGVYDVQADVGPAYATRRAEAFAAFSQLLSANKELFSIVGDVWMRFSDVPGAQEASERLRRMVPAQALGDGPTPEVAHLQQQIQEAQKFITELSNKLADRGAKDVWEEQKNAISAYKAQSDRLTALSKALGLDPQGLLVLVREVLEEAQATSAGGGALTHIAEPVPAPDQIHPDLGGQMQPPPPHTPPVDPNPIIAAANAPEPAAS